MYCSHFGLHRPPFNNTPDPSFYYSTPDHEEALATLQYATLNRKGFVLVTGEVGAGKTLTGRMFIRQVDRQASTAVITHTQLNARQLLAAICAEFELDVPADATNLQLADRLQEYLLDQFARDRFVVVLLDEAQNLPDESFEALRMLGNLEADDAKLLQVCILGQPELRDRFKSDAMRQLDQRLFRRFHLEGLTPRQTNEYIERRLSVAGSPRSDLFTPEALEKIYAGSAGIPRLINRVCDNALLTAYAQGRDTVDAGIVIQVLEQEGLNGKTDTDRVSAPLPEQEQDKQTTARIEEIYGAAPEIIEPPGQRPELQALREVVSRAAEQWPTLRESIERHRVVLQRSVEDAAARCRHAEEQIATLARDAAPQSAVEELRRLHHDQTTRVLDEIAASHASMQEVLEQTDSRVRETESRLHEMRADLVGKTELIRLEQHRDQEMQKALAAIDQHRRHVEQLVELLQTQCSQAQAGLVGLVESQVKLQNGVSSEAAARVQDMQKVHAAHQALRAEWAEQLDRSLGELGARLDRRLASTPTQAELDRVRAEQDATREQLAGEFHDRLVEIQARLQEEIRATKAEAGSALREDVTRVRDDLERQATHSSDALARLSNALERLRSDRDSDSRTHEQEIADIRERLGRQAEEIGLLSDQVVTRFDSLSRTLAEVKTDSVEAEQLEGLRQEYRAFAGDVLKQFEEKASLLDAMRQELDRRLGQAAADQNTAVSELAARVDSESLLLRRLQRRIHESREAVAEQLAHLDERYAGREQLEQLRAEQRNDVADQATAISDLYDSIARHEDEIRQLATDAVSRFESLTRGVGELKGKLPDQQQMQQLRSDHETFAREVLQRFERKSSDLEDLQQELTDRLDQATGAHATDLAAMSSRLESEAAKLRRLRRRLIESHSALSKRIASLDDRYAGRAELEALRQAQAADAGDMLERIQANRHAVDAMIVELSDRFRATHQRIDALGASDESAAADLAELRQIQAEDVASLLRQLEDQRRLSQEQFEQSLGRWTQSQREIAELRAIAADVTALESLRERQDRDSQAVLRLLDEQRHNLQSLIAAANERCEAMLARLEALPANVASTADIQILHEESRENKVALENAISSVAEQCDRTASALRSLEDRAAGLDSSLEQIRRDHAQGLDEIIQRLDGQSSEYQQEFEALNERWKTLRHELRALAGSTTPAKKFEATERLMTQDMTSLRQRLDEVAGRRRKDLRILVDVVQRLGDRVKQLEEADRPQPVRVELRPRAAEELAALNGTAEGHAARLEDLLAQTSAHEEQLRSSSARVETVMREWVEQATRIQEQSDQLRASAAASGSILQAMRKCHDAIDNKLKSAAWHGQLRRGEEVTARLEQALPKYQDFEDIVRTWQQERSQAEALVNHLEHLLAEANRATGRLARVGAMMAGVAGKSAISEAVESARQHDEQARPIRGTSRRNATRTDVEPVAWPKYRTHTQANAG